MFDNYLVAIRKDKVALKLKGMLWPIFCFGIHSDKKGKFI